MAARPYRRWPFVGVVTVELTLVVHPGTLEQGVETACWGVQRQPMRAALDRLCGETKTWDCGRAAHSFRNIPVQPDVRAARALPRSNTTYHGSEAVMAAATAVVGVHPPNCRAG
jgi:hypothetical protein